MKNSLFKRAFAAAAAVPMALTQCLTATSFAVTGSDAAPTAEVEAADEAITLTSLLYIAPEDTESKWNLKVAGALDDAVNDGNTQGTIDPSVLFDAVAKSAGKYSEVAKVVLSEVGTVNYKIADNGDVTLTAEVGNIAEALSADVNESLGDVAQKLADKYNAPELADMDFATVDISGTVKVVIKSGDLNNGTTLPVTFEFTDAEGKTYGPGEAVEYVSGKLAELKTVAYDAINTAAELDADAVVGAKADINDKFEIYEGWLAKASNAINKVTNMVSVDKSYGNASALIAAVNAKIKAKGYNKQIPGSGAAIMSNEKVVAVLNDAVAQANSILPVAVDFKADEIGSFIDELYAVNASKGGSNAVLNASFADAEAAEVAKYYEENVTDEEYVDSHKEITVSVDFSNIKATGASVDVKIKRIVETKPKTTTTTSTSTTTSSTTTTSDTTTTTSDTTTTTSDTTTTSTSTTTTTTSTTTTTTTTYVAVVNSYVEVESDYGFYMNIDDAFSADQINSAALHVNYKTVAVDEDGNETVIEEFEGKPVDIKGMIGFGNATPGNTYSAENNNFKYEVQLFYNGEDIVDEYGNTVLVDGAELNAIVGQATMTVYIGLKGDANLDNKVLANDAGLVLTYYANLSSGQGGADVDPQTVTLSDSALVDAPDSVYDNFAAFLCDVDTEISTSVAWKTGKTGRRILANDAAGILTYYSLCQKYEPGKETWEMAINGASTED